MVREIERLEPEVAQIDAPVLGARHRHLDEQGIVFGDPVVACSGRLVLLRAHRRAAECLARKRVHVALAQRVAAGIRTLANTHADEWDVAGTMSQPSHQRT